MRVVTAGPRLHAQRCCLSPATTALVAVVTIHAVVDISADALVILIGLCLGVTVRAGKDRVVVRVGVACGTHAVGVAVVGGEPRVVEYRTRPGRRAVTGVAGRGEARRSMVRIRCAGIVGCVAGVAKGG